ncbi:hypothetical protein RSAG8_01165, partial [Rhizoctonia solani AG-8 WAC10335]
MIRCMFYLSLFFISSRLNHLISNYTPL